MENLLEWEDFNSSKNENEKETNEAHKIQHGIAPGVNFDSFGGSLSAFISTYFGDKWTVGLNSSSRGSINYEKDLSKEMEELYNSNYKLFDKAQTEEVESINKDLEKLANKFDSELIALMKKHGYKLSK